jgi:hypothetical protein
MLKNGMDQSATQRSSTVQLTIGGQETPFPPHLLPSQDSYKQRTSTTAATTSATSTSTPPTRATLRPIALPPLSASSKQVTPAADSTSASPKRASGSATPSTHPGRHLLPAGTRCLIRARRLLQHCRQLQLVLHRLTQTNGCNRNNAPHLTDEMWGNFLWAFLDQGLVAPVSPSLDDPSP